MKLQAIVAAAGVGTRLQSDTAKPFVTVKGKPLVVYALTVLAQCDFVDSIVVAAEPEACDQMTALMREHGLEKAVRVVAGGAFRGQSIKNALAVLDEDTDWVLIHDGARPLITSEFVESMIRAAMTEDAMITGVPVKPTIKQVDPQTMTVHKTLDRSVLWDVQTPQIFRREILEEAYRLPNIDATDDAGLVEALGKDVKVFPGLEQNIKVTTPQDLVIVEQLL